MKTIEPRPFSAATNKFAFAQSFSGATGRRHLENRRSTRVSRGLLTFGARHTSNPPR